MLYDKEKKLHPNERDLVFSFRFLLFSKINALFRQFQIYYFAIYERESRSRRLSTKTFFFLRSQ